MFGFYVGASKLAGFESPKEDGAAGFFGVSLKHGASVTSSILSDGRFLEFYRFVGSVPLKLSSLLHPMKSKNNCIYPVPSFAALAIVTLFLLLSPSGAAAFQTSTE